MPAISVVIPSYNHAAYIGQAVQSVLDQSFDDWELIIIDDGSQDESLRVLSTYRDSRIQVHTQDNQGAHAALNKGLSLATGDYLAILNSDDVYTRKRLQKLFHRLETDNTIAIAGSYIQVINASGFNLGLKRGYHSLEPWLLDQPELSFRASTDLKLALLTENYLSTSSNYMFRRELFAHVDGFRPLRFAHDWDFALRAMQEGNIYLEQEPLLKYRIHGHNTINKSKPEMIFEMCWCLAVHLPGYYARIAECDGATTAGIVQGLLYSVYTYHADKVLSIMLVQNLAGQPQAALDLLHPKNETRRKYLDYLNTMCLQQPAHTQSTIFGKFKSYISTLLHL
ncbi:MAG: glycosyltransferase [Anaerolineae bacterium]|nr:glycosyltransferase [Anaerolineae bacterium]